MNSGKIILGTVQFGCQYGINSAGRPDSDMVRDILEAAGRNGIDTLDTSSAYGDAEQVLGRCLADMPERFSIVSKYPQGSGPVSEVFAKSLDNLGVKDLYGYLLHHFNVYLQDRSVWNKFQKLRESGRITKAGFSLYSPEELEILLCDGIDFDLIQIPRNMFDRRFDPYLPALKEKGVEIHVRSTFLQGLFFKDRDTLPQKLRPLGKYLAQLDAYSEETGTGISAMALGFNVQCPYVDKVLIGVDNKEQLLANIASISDKNIDIDIDVKEQELLSPVNWN